MIADAVPAASAETHRLRKSGEHITFGSLKQVTTRGMGTRTEDVPSCPLGYPHLVDNSICFPHSYPQYVDNSGFFGFLIHSEPIRALSGDSDPANAEIPPESHRNIIREVAQVLWFFPVHHTSKSWRSMAESNSWNNGLNQGQNRGFQAMAAFPARRERLFATHLRPCAAT